MGFKDHWHQVIEESELERWVEVIEQEVQIPEPVRGSSVRLTGWMVRRAPHRLAARNLTFSRDTSS